MSYVVRNDASNSPDRRVGIGAGGGANRCVRGGCAWEVHHDRCARRECHHPRECQRLPGGGRLYFDSSGNSHGFVNRHGRFTTVNTPYAGTHVSALSINDFGVLAGTYVTSTGTPHGFIDRRGRFTTVNDPHAGTGSKQATSIAAINNLGVIAGTYTDARGVQHGFTARHGVFTTVNHPHAGTASGQGTDLGYINDLGAVTGTYFNSRGQAISFAGRPGRFTTVNDPHAPAFSTFVSAINDSGVITGTYFKSRSVSHGFIERRGRYTTINDPNAGTGRNQGTGPEAISNLGVIVGISIDSHGNVHGFELDPAR